MGLNEVVDLAERIRDIARGHEFSRSLGVGRAANEGQSEGLKVFGIGRNEHAPRTYAQNGRSAHRIGAREDGRAKKNTPAREPHRRGGPLLDWYKGITVWCAQKGRRAGSEGPSSPCATHALASAFLGSIRGTNHRPLKRTASRLRLAGPPSSVLPCNGVGEIHGTVRVCLSTHVFVSSLTASRLRTTS